MSFGALAQSSAPPAAPQAAGKPAATPSPAQQAPLQLRSLSPETQADPFPPVNPKNFTADSPTVATVDSYLQAVIGWDANNIWRVEAIEKTDVPGVVKVVALVAQRGVTGRNQTALFFVLPDGKHLITGTSGPQPFGPHPYAENRALLEARANGPARGAASKELELVEFADLQCPRCKEAQATMARLAQDFPRARIVYEDFPVTSLHPYSYQAATYGQCIAQANPEAFFVYAQAVYDAQAALLPDTAEATLKAAVTKAGLDPEKVDACSKTPLGKDPIDANIKLAFDLGIEQTPVLMINGRPVPLGNFPYETLKQLIVYQAQMDGVAGAAAVPLLTTPAPPITKP